MPDRYLLPTGIQKKSMPADMLSHISLYRYSRVNTTLVP